MITGFEAEKKEEEGSAREARTIWLFWRENERCSPAFMPMGWTDDGKNIVPCIDEGWNLTIRSRTGKSFYDNVSTKLCWQQYLEKSRIK